MSSIEDRFALGSGRKRPSYKAMEIRCPNCNAQIKQKDDASELIVCDYCQSHIDVSAKEKKILRKGAGKKQRFELELGDSFKWNNRRYEVLARILYIEYDEGESYPSRDYYLYNPQAGTLWLNEYEGSYSLSKTSHLMPAENDYFSKSRGSELKTADGKEWIVEGSGTYVLEYVDGALPWQAQVDDRVDYLECSEKSGGKRQYELTRSNGELEFGEGQALTLAEVFAATRKPEFDPKKRTHKKKAPSVASQLAQYKIVLRVAIVCIIVNLILWFYASGQGSMILRQEFSPEELTQESFSKSFEISRSNDIIRIDAYAPVDDAWMNLDVGIVKDEDSLIHVYDNDISYYSGVDSDGGWSEGSRSSSSRVKIPSPGSYRLYVHAVSATGNASSAESSIHPVRLTVYRGTVVPGYFLASAVFSLIVLVITAFLYYCWKNEENPFDVLAEFMDSDD